MSEACHVRRPSAGESLRAGASIAEHAAPATNNTAAIRSHAGADGGYAANELHGVVNAQSGAEPPGELI